MKFVGWLLCIFASFGFSQEVNERIIFASARGHVDSLDLYLQEDSVNLDYRYPASEYTALDYAMERISERRLPNSSATWIVCQRNRIA